MFFKKSKKVNDELQQELQKLREENEKLKMCIVDWKGICRDSRIRMDELLLENQKLREENEKLKKEQKIIMRDRTYFINSGLIADSRLKDTYQKMKKLEKDLETERSLSSKLDMKMKKVRFS